MAKPKDREYKKEIVDTKEDAEKGFWEGVTKAKKIVKGNEFNAGILFVNTEQRGIAVGGGSFSEMAFAIYEAITRNDDFRAAIEAAVVIARKHDEVREGGKSEVCDFCRGEHGTPDTSGISKKAREIFEVLNS